ncbi:MAG: response regulator [Kiritimatiellaeota bacterium]|nr:response regulator [Kiritimatiellota bacterium]
MKRVLICDDDWLIGRLFTRFFEIAGYETDLALGGYEAMQRCAQHRPDVVVTDILMPEGDGFELIHHLRQNLPGVPIIAMTGSPDERLFQEAERLGVQRQLRKPFAMRQLLQAVQEELSPEQAGDTAAVAAPLVA